MAKVVIMERSDQAGAFQKVMRTAETESDSFGASGSGPDAREAARGLRFVPSRATLISTPSNASAWPGTASR